MSKPEPSGPKPLPAVQYLLVRYAKRGKMRFASHRDVARAFERGVRRAGLPVAHSAGFTPHPKISYAGGAPTGVASEAEYLSLGVTVRQEAAAVREKLDAALPDGIDVIDVTEEAGGLPADRLTVSQWLVILPGVTAESVTPAVDGFLALESAPVERLTNKGMRRMDARTAVVTLEVRQAESGDAELLMVARHTVPAVRPDDVLTALHEVSGLEWPVPPVMTRLAQGSLEGAGVVTP